MKNIKTLLPQTRNINFNDSKIDARVVLKVYDKFYIDLANIQHNISALYFDRHNKFIKWLM